MAADPLIHTADRLERDAAMLRQAAETEPPELADWMGRSIPDPRLLDGWEDGDIDVGRIVSMVPPDPTAFPEPVDCGHLTLSAMGGIEYVTDLIIPGRIHVVAAEEGTGKTYGLYELAIRMAAAGGDFAGTWRVEVAGPVVYLSEMHPDDDYRYQQDVLDALDIDRSSLVGRLYRLDLGTAANGAPALTVPEWRAWFTAWTRRRGVRLAVFDTGTGATQTDPWGKAIQQVYRDLRVMLAEHQELAVVLLLHLKKPQGKGSRRISDVLGEWGRWCDVLILMEAEGDERTKVSSHKRIRKHRRIVATRAGGLLIDPIDITDKAPAQKVPTAKVIAAVEAEPGLSYARLAEVLGVSKPTATSYVKALPDHVQRLPTGPRGQIRLFAVVEADRQPPNDHQTSVFGGALSVPEAGIGPVTANRQTHPIGEGALALRSVDPPPLDVDDDDYPASAWDPDA